MLVVRKAGLDAGRKMNRDVTLNWAGAGRDLARDVRWFGLPFFAGWNIGLVVWIVDFGSDRRPW